jgi:ATP-dependent Lon protease
VALVKPGDKIEVRIAIGEKFYRDNDRLLEGGIWAEVVIAHNDIDADAYAFYVEDLRPIQLTRFDFAAYGEAKKTFTRNEWIDVVLRSVGLEPAKLCQRVKLHFIARLAPLVESNFNFIELGPRGTGKSYFFSEFSPYSTLISGGQATKSVFLGHGRVRRGRWNQDQRSGHDPDHEGLHGQRPLLARRRGHCGC